MNELLELAKQAIIKEHGAFNLKEEGYAVAFNDAVLFLYIDDNNTLQVQVEAVDKVVRIDKTLDI